MGRKLALVIGNSQYDDPGLARLPTADVDVRELANVLRAQEVGQFDDVIEVANQGIAVVRRSVAYFFSEARRDDLLLLYFSGHGVKDEQGHLYLAVKDTERPLLAGTGIEAAFITSQMDRSHSKRQVLILDCCHSGAFAYGVKAGDAGAVGTGPAFEGSGYGRVVLTATDSTQYAWEGDQVIGGESDKSVFTHYLLQGLKTGEADCDDDGLITIDELYDYVYEHVVRETPKQTPGKWTYKQQGDIVVARNSHPLVRPAELPLEVRALLESPLSRLRAEAVPELAGLLQKAHRGLALAARKALEDLRADDSRKVSAAAEEVLATLVNAAQAAALSEEADRRAEQERTAANEAERVRRDAREETRRREELEERGRERRQKAAALVGRAEQAASHQAAIEDLNEALVLNPEHEAGRQLLARRTAAFEQERHDRLASEAVQGARDEFTAGRHDSAVAALERFRPQHPLVSRTLADLEADIEGIRRQEEERRRAEAERLVREREIVSLRDAARLHIERQQFVEALEALRSARHLDPKAAGLTELVEAAERGKTAAEEADQRRHESKGKQPDTLKMFGQRNFAKVVALVEEARRLGPQNSAATELRVKIQPELNERAIVAGSAGSPEQTREAWVRHLSGAVRSVQSALRLQGRSQIQLGLVAVLMVSSFALYGVLHRQASVSETLPGVVTPAAPGLETPTPPLTAPQLDPAPAQPPSSIGRGQERASAPPRPTTQPVNPGGAPRESQVPSSEPPNVPTQVAPRENTSQAILVLQRLSRAEQRQDTGDYDGALREIDEALAIEPKNTAARDLRQRVLDAQSFERSLRPRPR